MKLLQALLLLCGFSAYGQTGGLPPDKKLTQYILDVWTADQGLPSNSTNRVFQNSEGYIWIAGYEGLTRFDGVTFMTFNKKNTPAFQSNSVHELLESPDGTMYIGTHGSGLVAYKNRKFTQVLPEAKFQHPIDALMLDKSGLLWIGTRGEGIYTYDGFSFKHFKKNQKLEAVTVSHIMQDQSGAIWFATEGEGLFKYEKESFTRYGMEDGLYSDRVGYILESPSDKRVWIGTINGLNYLEAGKIKPEPYFEKDLISSIEIDQHGSLWIGSKEGIHRRLKGGGAFETFSEAQGLSHKVLTHLLFDREGSLWISTYRGGLCRFKDGKFLNYTQKDGMLSATVWTVAEMSPDVFVVGTDIGKINLLKDGKITELPFKSFMATDRIKTLLVDSKKNIWAGNETGLLKIAPDGKETKFDTENGFPDQQVRSIYEDKTGNIWVATRSSGAVKIAPGGEMTIYNRDKGLSSNFIMSVGEDSAGNYLLGTNGAGLDVIGQDGKVSVYKTEDGLASNLLFGTYTEPGGVVWICTNTGLSRFKNGKFFTITSEHGLSSDSPFDLVEHDGLFWMASSLGLFSVKKQELNDLADGKTTSVQCRLLTKEDGLPHKECTGTSQITISSRGWLVFPTLGGLSMINPKNIKTNPLKPPVLLVNMLVDGQPADLSQAVSVPPGAGRFVFEYTALSYISPGKVQFKFMLKGYDNDFISAGNKREVEYTALAPGTYTFQVIASNNDGVWNDTGTQFVFELQPYFYQTKTFYALCGLSFLLLVFAVYRWRVKQVELRNKELEELVRIRTSEINMQKEEIESQRDNIEKQNGILESQKGQLQESFKNINTLSEIGQKVTASLKLEDIVSTVHFSVHQLMKAEGFGIGVYNKGTKELDFKGYIEKGESLPDHSEKLDPKKHLSAACFLGNKEILINNLPAEIQKYIEWDQSVVAGEVPLSLIYLPLVIENRPIGVITVQSFSRDSYTEQHLAFLQTLAAYTAIALDNYKSYEIIQNKNRNITDSIRYAGTIQQAVLPSSEKMYQALHDYFVVYRPKDIVSGDFYWFTHIDEKIFIAAVDCTGHGVPGAFMSMIGSAFLNEIVNVEEVYSPAGILDRLHLLIRYALKQEEDQNDDGMDLGICLLEDADDFMFDVTYAGAKRPMFYIDAENPGTLQEIKGTKKSIGGKQKKTSGFENNRLQLKMDSIVYLSTDGLADQQDMDKKKFGTTALTALLLEISPLEMPQQKARLEAALDKHQNGAAQRDDITFIGVKL